LPVYEYEHEGKGCKLGKVFELEQPISERLLTACPECGRPVSKLISAPSLSFPRGNTELKDRGFTKLVRRDSGVYENVTARKGESKVVQLGDHSTYPDPKKGRKK
jgi:putative FmdB family regulatory protein